MIYFGKNSILKYFQNPKIAAKEQEAPRQLQYLIPVNTPEIRVQIENTKSQIRIA